MTKDRGRIAGEAIQAQTTHAAGVGHSSICGEPYINVTVLIDRITGNYDRMIAILSAGGRR